MKTTLLLATPSPIALLKAPIPPEPGDWSRQSLAIPITATSAHPHHQANRSQPTYYFIPSDRPLWQNPLNDF